VQLPPEVEIVNSSSNGTSTMLSVTVDNADSCGSFTAMTVANDNVASTDEISFSKTYVVYRS